MSDIHERKCHDCGNVAIHQDSITPWVLCPKCGSQDTRRTTPVPPRETTHSVVSIEWFDQETPDRSGQTAIFVDGFIGPVRAGDKIIYVRAK